MFTPTPPSLKAQSSANELKTRLDWGEPALTIIDVRDRDSFNKEHIRGAVSIPLNQLVRQVQASLERNRDIYLYGEMDEETAQAAALLREAGFEQVAELKGGISAWKAIAAPTEGIAPAS